MSRQQEYYFNEHDENQVQKKYKSNQRLKVKRRIKILFVLLVFILVGTYFISDYSRISKISIQGCQEVKQEDVLKTMTLKKGDIILFVNTNKIEEEIKKMPLVKKVNVQKSIFGEVLIEIEEAQKIAYCIIDKTTYIIDELGNVTTTSDKELIQSMQSSPRLSGFDDVDLLKKFAREYIDIPDIVKSQTSDIVYSPKKADQTRMKFIMDNGKILYLRIEQMVEQLSRFDYEANMTEFSDYCEFSFEGENIYMKKCK